MWISICLKSKVEGFIMHWWVNFVFFSAKKLKLQQIGSFRVLNGKVDLSTHEYQLTLTEWETKLANLREETNIKSISKEINVAKTVQTVKVLAYKNGEGRLRPGEIICGSSVHGVSVSLITTCSELHTCCQPFSMYMYM